MKTIVIILATGALVSLPMDKKVAYDCYDQGRARLEIIATYYGPGPDQGWVLNNSRIEVGGWFCR